MNDLLDENDPALSRNERELTLSTGAILGIFLALVLLCGACFGVGYNMGRKSAPAPLALNDGTGDAITDTSSVPKPAAGSPVETPPAPAPAAATPKPAPIVRKPPVTPPVTAESEPGAAPIERPENTAPIARSVPAAAPTPIAGGTGSVMVQVAAVSHQEDADLLLGALRARGYTVSARPSSADNFIHVQVGPFGNKKDAEAMRQRLLADGYNAMLKF